MATPDIQELLRLHIDGMAKLRELLEECRRLHDAGRIAEARGVFRRAEGVRRDLEALEAACRPKVAREGSGGRKLARKRRSARGAAR